MPKSFVQNGKPVFGTFSGHPKRLDIRGVFRPYGVIPLPTFITNLRIKSRLAVSFHTGEFIGRVSFIDAKIMGFCEVIFWNESTAQKFVYRSLMGPRKRIVPHDLNSAATSNYQKSRYVRISWDREKNKLSLVFDLKGDDVRPWVRGNFSSEFGSGQFAELTSVRPSPTFRRCSAGYSAIFPSQGNISMEWKNGEKKSASFGEGISFFSMTRNYMKFRSQGESIVGMGTQNGKIVSFLISSDSQDAVDTQKFNANVLFFDGKVTPLPHVVITHFSGMDKNWVIQDTENMVDLTFSPKSRVTNKVSAFFVRTIYHTIYGTLEGTIVSSEGEKISFKSMMGVGENFLIRL